jgi:hypothetical protein
MKTQSTSDAAKLKKIENVANDERADPNVRAIARSKAAKLRNEPPDLQYITIQTAKPRPSAGFHGRVEEGKFAEVDGSIQLYSMDDRSLGRKFCRKIVPPLNARETAAILLRSKVNWKSSSFSRPLIYPKGF